MFNEMLGTPLLNSERCFWHNQLFHVNLFEFVNAQAKQLRRQLTLIAFVVKLSGNKGRELFIGGNNDIQIL